jgi:predicted dehydrogenase
MNRREFIGTAAGALVGSAILSRAGTSPSDRINLAVIGAGSRGQQLMRTMLRIPGVRFQAICDVYEPRFAQAQKITSERTPTYNDYRELLAAKDIDAVLVATPLSFHAQHVIAALDSGRHVYGEKSMALTTQQCADILNAVQRSRKIYQVGFQYRYAPWYQEALRAIWDGKIGKVTHIYSYWHRNSNWRRPVPDPKDRNLERLINWRLYREYSGGLLAELGSHHIDFANQVFGGMPESVVGSGGIDYWKDGREVDDNVQVVYRYSGGQTHSFSAITTNRLDGAQLRVYGTAGSFVLTEADGTYYYEPATKSSAVPDEVVVEHGIRTGASYRAEMPYRGPGAPIAIPEGKQGSADFMACSGFISDLRANRRPLADEHAGYDAGVAVALGNQAIETGSRVRFGHGAAYAAPAWRNSFCIPAMLSRDEVSGVPAPRQCVSKLTARR